MCNRKPYIRDVGEMTKALVELLARNPGATEASVRSYLRGEYGSSEALTEALASGTVVREGHKVYLKGTK